MTFPYALKIVKQTYIVVYADDTTIHKSGGKHLENINDDVQEDLYRVEEWCKMNNMFIDANETKCLITGTKQKLFRLFNQT